ncbi:MAG: CcmD family protein [Bacteroidetes bacterium]|nr:CcmD family protein [Bacteroidota bacterium]MBS1539435.1 CcmD family protein [Bacteroidota bacterium]
MKKISSILLFLCFASTALRAQEAQMADTMRSEGKIYALVAIILVILLGLIFFLVFIDRKVSRLEKRMDGKN